MTDEMMAEQLRGEIARLNETLAEAARNGLRVEIRHTAHQTAGGAPMIVIEAEIYKRL